MKLQRKQLRQMMLMLIFQVGEQKFALNTGCVVEILPAIPLQQIHATSKAIAGLFNYQGKIIPVVSLNYLLEEAVAQRNLSQRIILIRQKQANQQDKIFGLLVEKISETLAIEASELQQDNDLEHFFQNSYLGETFLRQNNILQRLHPEHLLSDQEYRDLIEDVELNEQPAT